MAEVWTPGRVYLGERILWDEELSLYFASDLLMYMTHNSADVIREYVIPHLKIADKPLSKKQLDALAGEDPIARAIAGRLRYLKRRSALKAMAMELVCASLMRYLDRCRQTIAHCKTEFGEPHGPAPSGNHPDISGLFPRTPSAQEFAVHMEVSAKRNMSLKKFREQLTWGYNHCVKTREKYPGLIVYCLLINGAESYKNNRHHDLYRSFLKQNSLDATSDIRMLPWCAKDFAALTGDMFFDLTPEQIHQGSDVLLAALDAVMQLKTQTLLPDDRMWMNQCFRETFQAQSNLALDETKGPGER